MSIQDVTDLENSTHFNPDSYKLISDAVSQPADLGAEAMHSYYNQLRMCSDPSYHYTFEDIFDKRQWLHAKIPSIAGYIQHHKTLVAPQIYQVT